MERIWCVTMKLIAKSLEGSICYAMACSSCLRIQDCWGMKWLAHHGVILSAMRWNEKWRPTMCVSSKGMEARWYAGVCWEWGMADGSEMEEKWHSQCQHVSETDPSQFWREKLKFYYTSKYEGIRIEMPSPSESSHWQFLVCSLWEGQYVHSTSPIWKETSWDTTKGVLSVGTVRKHYFLPHRNVTKWPIFGSNV